MTVRQGQAFSIGKAQPLSQNSIDSDGLQIGRFPRRIVPTDDHIFLKMHIICNRIGQQGMIERLALNATRLCKNWLTDHF